jgi:ubiquinone/menaquinone biosynthesis C-methylase UbiE
MVAQPMPANISLAAIRADEKERDQREKLAEISLALHLGPGSVVGDLGAGYGYYAVRFSPIVGPAGRVFAEEIDAPLLEKMRRRIQSDQLKNITLVLGTPDDPKFPESTLDAVIVSDVYHEIEKPGVVLSRVRQALKPGGLLIVVDYLKPELRDRTRSEQAKQHNIAPAFVELDLKQAGFTLVERRDPYCPGYDRVPTYFIVARR